MSQVFRNSSTSHARFVSELGLMTIVQQYEALIGLYFEDHWRLPDHATFGPVVATNFEEPRVQLQAYLSGRRRSFQLSLALDGDPFDRLVWEEVGTGRLF